MIVSVVAAIWLWGVASVIGDLFPYPQLRAVYYQSREALSFLMERSGLSLPLYYTQALPGSLPVETRLPGQTADGLILMSRMAEDAQQVVDVIDDSGEILHEWRIDWFDLWPNPDHLDEDLKPKSRPGTSIHGIVLLPDGDLVFNFENLGMIRLDFCGNVVWRLPYQTHHSLEVDDDGNFWAGGKRVHHEPDPKFPNYAPPFDEFTAVEVSPDGKLLREISVFDLLERNGLRSLLYMSTRNNYGTRVSGDTLHLNDVEVFPAALTPGVFQPGDIMISLRNLNALIVFDPETLRIKYMYIGELLRQHDPDFVDGNTISVFDNNNLSPASIQAPLRRRGQGSRIVVIDARDDTARVFYEGTATEPFFSDIMGKHQHLPNGNMMVNSARAGRAFELTPDGRIAWQYFNLVGEDLVGLVDDTQRLQTAMDRARLAELGQVCSAQ